RIIARSDTLSHRPKKSPQVPARLLRRSLPAIVCDSTLAEKARLTLCLSGTPASYERRIPPPRLLASRAETDSASIQGVSMSRYLGPKVRLSRRLGVAIADLPKHNKTEFTAPGMHGLRSQRLSE